MSGQGDVAQVQRFKGFFDIVGKNVIVVFTPWLGRFTEAAHRNADTTITMQRQLCELILKHLMAQWPTGNENDHLALSPIPYVEMHFWLNFNKLRFLH